MGSCAICRTCRVGPNYEPAHTLLSPLSPKSGMNEGAVSTVTMVSRCCENCGGELYVSSGRHSGLWFWSHLKFSDCIYDQTGARIFFETKWAAETAEKIWK